jgi:hypothetical protein
MKIVTAFIAAAALAMVSIPAQAGKASRSSSAEVTNDSLSRRAPQVRGYVFRPGGHQYQFEYEPFLRWNGPYVNQPRLDPRNFRERVFSDPRQDTTSPSAF